jgi:hypothetical protein
MFWEICGGNQPFCHSSQFKETFCSFLIYLLEKNFSPKGLVRAGGGRAPPILLSHF